MAWGKFKIAKLHNIIRSGSKTERKIGLKVCLCGRKICSTRKFLDQFSVLISHHISTSASLFSPTVFFSICVSIIRKREQDILPIISGSAHCSFVCLSILTAAVSISSRSRKTPNPASISLEKSNWKYPVLIKKKTQILSSARAQCSIMAAKPKQTENEVKREKICWAEESKQKKQC